MRDWPSSGTRRRPDAAASGYDAFRIGVAVTVLRSGGIVAHATEGVWGLACDPFDFDTVGRLLALKGRSVRKGLIVIGADAADFAPEIAALDEGDAARVLSSWPGASTWLVPNLRFPNWISGGRTKVAVRVPGHSQARRMCARFGGPLVSTSANPSGRPAALDELTVRRYFGGEIDYVLHGETSGRGEPSTIRDASTDARLR